MREPLVIIAGISKDIKLFRMRALLTLFFLVIISYQSISQDRLCSPSFRDIFNYNIGDKYTYKNTDWDGSSGTGDPIITYSFPTFEISNKLLKGDTTIYIIDGHVPPNSVIQSDYDPFNEDIAVDTIILIDSLQHKLNQCNDSLVSFLYNYGDTIYTLINLEIIDTLLIKTLGYNYFHYVDGELQPYYDLFYIEKYAKGIGLFYKEFMFGEYAYTVELANYIKDGDTTVFITSTEGYPFSSKISYYPNPVTDILTIQTNNLFVIKSLKIYNMSGKLIHQKNELIPSNIFTIDMSSFDEGMYILVIDTDFEWLVKKITKIHKSNYY